MVETAKAELRRRRLLSFLQNPQPAWRDEDHPELAKGSTSSWVKKLRAESEPRPRAEKRKRTK